MVVWLQSLGMRFEMGTTAVDMDLVEDGDDTVVTGLALQDTDGERYLELTRDDLVFFTNGSLTQNSTMGDTDTVARLDTDTLTEAVRPVGEAGRQGPQVGDPSVFLWDVDKTNFITFFPTIRGDRTFFDHMEAMSGDAIGTGGAMTIVDSSWKLGFVLYNTYFPGQPDDVNVFWAYGQVTDARRLHQEADARVPPALRCSPSCSTTAAWRTRLTTSLATPRCRHR